MKTNAIVRIVIYSLVILLLLGILAMGMGIRYLSVDLAGFFSDGDRVGFVSADSMGEPVSVDASVIREIQIDWAAGSIVIEPSESADQITFRESQVTDSKFQLVYKQSGDTLTIQYCKDSLRVNIFDINSDTSKDLVITVPADWVCQDLEVNAAAANLDIHGLTLQSVEFNGASGICNFVNCAVGEIDLETASGDVRFSGTLDSMSIDGMSANCRVTVTNIPREIKMNSMSGDLDLTLPADCGFTASIDAMSSDFHSDFPTSISGDHHIYGDGSCRISIDAMSGDIYIRKGQ